jgi:hypothetical protein
MGQVYRRIANPYMPNGTPDKTNAVSPAYAPGEVGCAFTDQNTGNDYLRVWLDSGATSATGIGAVAAGQLAFWKSQPNNIVTNDKNQCDVGPSGAINRVAGVFQLAVTTAPGVNDATGQPAQYLCDLLIKSSSGNPASVVAASALAGAQATANTTANHADVVYTTGVNTAPVSQVLGVFSSSTITSGSAQVQVAIGFAE